MTGTGTPCSFAHSIWLCRSNFHSLTGAMILRPGFSALKVRSNLTWSFPFPVHPWATAWASSISATSTTFFAMRGLLRLLLTG